MKKLEKRKESGLDERDFERSRKKRIGGFLRMMNSPESIANEFTKYRFKGIDLFDMLPVYREMTLESCQSTDSASILIGADGCFIVQSREPS